MKTNFCRMVTMDMLGLTCNLEPDLQIDCLDVQCVWLENCSQQVSFYPMQRYIYFDSVRVLLPAACCQNSEGLHGHLRLPSDQLQIHAVCKCWEDWAVVAHCSLHTICTKPNMVNSNNIQVTFKCLHDVHDIAVPTALLAASLTVS